MEKQTITHHGHTFELVDRVPRGYFVWNIGKNMIDGYLPLCGWAFAIGWVPETPEEMERYIEQHERKGTNAMEVELMKMALPLMRQIWWD